MDNLHLPSANDIADSFLDFLHNNNITPKKHIDIIADRLIHRFSLLNDDNGEKSGAYCIFTDNGWPIGWAEDWHVVATIDWRYNSDSIPQEQQNYLNSQEFKDKVAASKKKWEEQKIIQHNAAATKARDIFNNSDNAPEDNPYLQAKHIFPYGVKISEDGRLIVPLRNIKGELRTLQFIYPDGSKRFVFESSTDGAFWLSLSIPLATRTTLFFSARALLLWPKFMSLLASHLSPLSPAMP